MPSPADLEPDVYAIYAWTKRGFECLYVGSTTQPLNKRLYNHIAKAKTGDSPFYRFLRDYDPPIGPLRSALLILPTPYTEEDEAIEAYRPRFNNRSGGAGRSPRKWTQEEIDLLGTAPDGEVAEMIGVSISTIERARHRLGIDAWQGQHWTKLEDLIAQLDLDIDTVQALTGRSKSAIRCRRSRLS